MQALRPGPEWRFRVPVQSTDSGAHGVSKKRSVVSGASFQEHHFESIISRGQAKQSACCTSPLVSSALQNIVRQGARPAALVIKQWQQWAESLLFPVHKGLFPDGHRGKQQEMRGCAGMLSSATCPDCPDCQGCLAGLSGQRPPLPDRTEPPCAGTFPRNVFCSLPGTGRKECAFGKIFRCIEIFT